MASEKQMLALLRAAVDRYQMIHADDRVAVGVSGGKDSLALLTLLAALRKFYPIPFTLTAITLDLQFNGKAGDFSQIQQLCERLDVPYVVRKTDIFDTVFRQKQEKNILFQRVQAYQHPAMILKTTIIFRLYLMKQKKKSILRYGQKYGINLMLK